MKSNDRTFHRLRAGEFARLDAAGHAYLDYTGSGLYAESHVRDHLEMLRRTVLGNPHSQNPTSRTSTSLLEETRRRVLRFFGAAATEYEVCFTPNASGALKLVGEGYPFETDSRFVLTADNHNSVNGIRAYAEARGARVEYLPLDRELRLQPVELTLPAADPARANLFAFPAQSNFSGVTHPLDIIELAHDRGYDVLLDAAAFVPTHSLKLQRVKPDFVAVSFYKMFGYPTGVGALIARRDALARLRRPWFAGGTVRYVSVQNRLHLLKDTGEAFEDGTPNFLGISALAGGFDLLERVGMDALNRHVMDLTARALHGMTSLEHENGRPVVELYGPADTRSRGATIAFNARDATGAEIAYQVVERRAGDAGISLRTGCFCNPGASEFAFGFRDDETYRCFTTLSPEEFSLERFSTCMNDAAVGAVRISLGIASNEADVDRFLEVLAGLRGFVARGAERKREAAAVSS
jgi:molybdenum cofactor sulfurtransferase